MKVNIKKSKLVHMGNMRSPQCKTLLMLDEKEMQYVSDYKYLGFWINGFGYITKTGGPGHCSWKVIREDSEYVQTYG